MTEVASEAERTREFVERMRNGVGNLRAPEEIHEDWTRWLFESAFEGVWGRPGLTLQQRSIATISALAALRRPDELRSHIRIGLRNGLSRAEIGELLMHIGVYGGVPVAVEGMRIATKVFEALDAPDG